MSRSVRRNFTSFSAKAWVIAVVAMAVLAGCERRSSTEETDTAREAALASEHSPTLGSADAKVHIVEFLDPACETCALFFPMVKSWMDEVPGEIRLRRESA